MENWLVLVNLILFPAFLTGQEPAVDSANYSIAFPAAFTITLPDDIDIRDLDTVYLERPANFQELKEVVRQHGRMVVFDPETQELLRDYYLTPDGQLQYKSRALFRVARALQAFERIHLEIAVRGEDPASIRVRKEELKLAFTELGLPRRKYKILDFEPAMISAEWLWQDEYADVLMRLMLR